MSVLRSLSDLFLIFGPEAQARDNKNGAAAEAGRREDVTMINLTTSVPATPRPNRDIPGRSDTIDRARLHAEEWIKSRVARGQIEVFSEEGVITPAIAELLLKRNPDNRNIKKARISEIKADLEGGRYVLNGEPIIVSKDGLLNDGQHRLLACVESGLSFRSVVVFGVTRSSRLTLDQGGARTVSDYLDMQGSRDNTKVAATVGRMLWQFSRMGRIAKGANVKGGGRSWPTKAETLLVVSECEHEIARSIQAVQHTSRLVGSFSFVVFCRIILTRANDAMGGAFIDRLLDGSNLKPESPIFMLRERFINDPKMSQPDRLEAIVRAWNATRQGRTLAKIQIMGNVPKIEG
ncbi:hypothetical protein [Methylobacterium oryzisoli]|uniref:hypothetical protein n=1 Tax=Methylobacterium oryzisoli TaxID=3385502 RepID=UPI0038922710